MSGARLLFATTGEPAYDQRMQRICTTLAGAGHEVCLLGRRRKNAPDLSAQPYEQVRLRCFFEKGKLFYLEFNLRLLFYLLFRRFDALCAVDLDTIGPCFLAAKAKGRPLVYDAHEYFTEVPEVVGRPLVKRAWEMLAAALLPRLRYACTVGPALAEVLGNRYGIRFDTFRNVPWSSDAPPSLPDNRPFFLYQGVLNEGRGLERAILAMHRVQGAELWLAGEGDLSEELRRLCEREGLSDRVRFLGYLSPDELRALSPRAFLGLNLLENKGLSYYFSLANKFFDYLQAGVPSVSPDFPEYRAVLADHEVGWLLGDDDGSPESLADFLNARLADPAERARKSANCFRYRELFCWENESGRLLLFWGKVLEKKS